ncbi:hypothetical protein AVEN_246613-1 [Araneus ventricosus]|uniref:Uncharacterized protein n=1 Tax=Araneus ventricosus TaxID=182803 RepID=A0A4Y2DEI7_ARAVE|nr:hypothetical protein AVEN_246613-1 [Araneus ventricosus]
MSKIITGVFGSRILQRKYDSMHEPLCEDRCFGLAALGSFCQDGDVIFCKDIDSLFKALELQYNPQEWRLFIAKQFCYTMVTSTLRFMQNAAVRMKETYETLKHMLSSIEYSKHSWHICADLKVIAVLVGLQAGYTNFFAFCASGTLYYRTPSPCLHQLGYGQDWEGPVK